MQKKLRKLQRAMAVVLCMAFVVSSTLVHVPNVFAADNNNVYQPDYSAEGAFNWYSAPDSGDVKPEVVNGNVVAKGFKGYLVDLNSPDMTDGKIEFTMNISSAASVGILYRAKSKEDYSMIALDYNQGKNTFFAQQFIDGKQQPDIQLPGNHTLDFNKDIDVALEVDEQHVKVSMDGTVVLDQIVDYAMTSGGFGIRVWDGWGRPAPDVTIKNVKVTPEIPEEPETPEEPESAVYAPDYSEEGAFDWYSGPDNGITSVPEVVDGNVVTKGFKGYLVDQKAPNITNGKIEFTMNVSSAASVGILYRAQSKEDYSMIALDYNQGNNTLFAQQFIGGKQQPDIQLSGNHTLAFNKDIDVALEADEQHVKVWMDGKVVVDQDIDYMAAPGKFGIRVWDGWGRPAPDVTIKNVKVTPKREPIVYTPDYSKEGAFDWDVVLDGGVTSELKPTEDGGVAAEKFKGHAIDMLSPDIQNGEIEFTMNQSSWASFAVIFRAQNQANLSYVAFDKNGSSGVTSIMLHERIDGKATDTNLGEVEGLEFGKDTKIRLKYVDSKVTLYRDDVKIAEGTASRVTSGRFGFRIWEGWGRPHPDITIKNVVVREILENIVEDDPITPMTLTTDDMTVKMDDRFPSVYEYQIGDKVIDGQKDQLRKVELNGTEYYVANVKPDTTSSDTIEYTMDVIDVLGDSDIPENPENEKVLTSLKIKFTANAKTLRMDVLEIKDAEGFMTKTIAFPGQSFATVKNTDTYKDAQARILTLAAGFGQLNESDFRLRDYPNSEKIAAYAVINDENFAMTMESNVIETTKKLKVRTKTNATTKQLSLENGAWTYRAPGNNEYWGEEELPWAVLSITGDANEDGSVDWQDGAIAYREIGVRPYGWEDVRENISHIFMNCASGASQPFMRQLDTIKTMYNYYDGFGQMILEKGYNGEGHDDVLYDLVGHVNERCGGEEDFKYLLKRAKDFNAKIGVHVNVNEYTLDSWGLSEDNYLYQPPRKAWGYLDQSYANNVNQEILDGAMDARMQKLVDAYPDLAWVYIDVFNGIDWYADKMADVLNRNGIPVGTEYRGPMEKDMVWVHNSNDIHYPVSHGQDTPMYRMMKNSWADIFPPHELLKNVQFPSVGAWEHTTDFNEGISVFFNNNLAVKYMQHQDIMKMSGTEVVFDKGLRVVKEDNAELGMGTRVNMYQDDRLIATLPIGNKRPTDTSDKNTYVNSKVFIPWYNEDNAEKNPLDADKIYYWNAFDTTSTWELPENWASQETVKLYELTNSGREFVKEINVTDGKVTIKAEKEVPYIVLKSDEKVEKQDNNWGENTLVKEPGFDSLGFESKAWTVEGEGAVNAKNSRGDADVLVQGKEASLTQKIKGLEPGKNYTFSVWTDVRGQMRSNLEVKVGSRTLGDFADDTSAFTRQERNHKYGYSTYQQLRVNVTVPEGVEDAVITLSTENAGADSSVRFDDVRVFESYRDAALSKYTFFEDFENVPENFGPFAYATPGWQSIEQVHLAEKNPDPEKPQVKHYVVDGRFSLKLNNNSLSNARILRTMPSSLRLEANTEYEMGLDYFTRRNGTYKFSVKDSKGQEVAGSALVLASVEEGKTGNASVTFTTPDDPDCYVEVYQIGGIGDIEVDYLSVDNFYVNDLSDTNAVPKLYDLYQEACKIENDNYTAESWAAFHTSLNIAESILRTTGVVINNEDAANALRALEAAKEGLEKVDKEALADLIAYAESQKEDENYQYVIPVVKEAFEKALAEAIAVNDNASATQAEVDAAYDKLLEVIGYLDYTGNSESLRTLVDVAKAMNPELYTEETWAVLTDALVKAEAVLADENALQAEIDAAAEELQAAMDALVKVPVDKSKLEKLVNRVEKYEDKIADYIPATAEIFTNALAHARDILVSDDVTQKEINAAYTALENARFGLTVIADKDKLEKAIEKAEKVDTSDYTEESVAVFHNALERAKTVFADKNATKDDVKAAEKELKTAQKDLVKLSGKKADAAETLMSGVEAVLSLKK